MCNNLFSKVPSNFKDFQIQIKSKNHLKELQELNDNSKLSLIKFKKYRHLQYLYNQFQTLAEIWIDYLTQYLTNANKQTNAYNVRFRKATRYLIKYEILNVNDLIDKIPKCSICGNYLSLSSSVDKVSELYVLKLHCGSKECNNKYTYLQTSKSIMEKYGVDNISRSDEIKKKKEETCLKNHGVRYPQQSKEVREKLKKNNLEKYGVENVSQLDEVKEKKKKTFEEHYGVDNIFKRNDLMKKYWMDKLGVTNPVYLPENLLKFTHNGQNKKIVKYLNKNYIILSDLEEIFLKKVINLYYKTKNYYVIKNLKVNEDYLIYYDKDIDTTYAWVIDISWKNKYLLELKTNNEDLKKYEQYIFLSKVYNKKMWIHMINSNQQYTVYYENNALFLKVRSNAGYSNYDRIDNLLKNISNKFNIEYMGKIYVNNYNDLINDYFDKILEELEKDSQMDNIELF